jgi:hypothetical protein
LEQHKNVSNNSDVMSSLPSEDLAKDLMTLDLTMDVLPIQRGLGMNWIKNFIRSHSEFQPMESHLHMVANLEYM